MILKLPEKYTLNNTYQYTMNPCIVVAKGGKWIFINKKHGALINKLILEACNDKNKQIKKDEHNQLIIEDEPVKCVICSKDATITFCNSNMCDEHWKEFSTSCSKILAKNT